MKVVILKDADSVAQYGASVFVKQVKAKSDSVLGLATGSTPVKLYKKLIEEYRSGNLSFKEVVSFNLDEYMGLSGDHPQSYRYFMNAQLFNYIDIDKRNTFVPCGNAENPFSACEQYETAIKNSGGIDLQLLGIGRNGHIGFNEPSSSLASRTRVKTLTKETIDDNARFFKPGEFQPSLSITMGIGTILESKRILMLATGDSKAEAVKAMVEGPLTAACPASVLQLHQHVDLVLDSAAASLLKNCDMYRHIEEQNKLLLERIF